jgi:hypothetical protein
MSTEVLSCRDASWLHPEAASAATVSPTASLIAVWPTEAS